MTERPYVLDNQERSHADALEFLLEDHPIGHALAVAVGYVDLEGLHRLATALEPGRRVRLLLGAEPERGLGTELPTVSFQVQLDALRGERDLSRFPPSRAARRLQAVHEWIESDDVEVRRYGRRFLHGKAYLLGSSADPRSALVTSANLTGGGLLENLELGLVDYNPGPSGLAMEWFDGLWADAEEFKGELVGLLFPGIDLVDPETVYLRALLELYAGELEDERAAETVAVRLAPFQRDGYERARRVLADHGGVIYADGVGTGKTVVGLAFMEEYVLQEGRLALVVCSAQLKEMWEREAKRARIAAEVLSYQELATDEQLMPDAAGAKRRLASSKDAYRLVVIDEAHALRNEGTTWYRAMERLLGGERKDAVLLTATPVNNGLWDLYNLVLLFARHDRAFAGIGIPSARELFLQAGANARDPESLDPDVLFPLADAVSVRRDRQFIQEHYPEETFRDGTPVRFPEPRLRTHRYDLDDAHPGLFADITANIEALEMARYRPSAHLREPEHDQAEEQLGGLLQSAILKRFESCWAACLATVDRMIKAHDAFLTAWDEGRGSVPSRGFLMEAARDESGEAGLAEWVTQQLEGDVDARPAEEFRPDYGEFVAADRERLVAIRERLRTITPEDDPKLRLLADLLERSEARKLAVFASYGETVRYLDRHLPELVGGRERVLVIGAESTPDERTRSLARFCPETVVEPGYTPPDGEVDLVLSTDVLSEGQNLQQAQAVVSYDMPWNPQRVVQRNGRVIRLRSPHEQVHLTTMLPEAGELEELLRLEAIVHAKIRAAGLFGMESEVIEGIELELRSYAGRLAAGDPTLATEDEPDADLGGAFIGEELRARLLRAAGEGEVERLRELPWGIGAVIRRRPESRSRGRPGVFFAARTRPLRGEESGHRYWRYVELGEDGELLTSDLEMLRRIDPHGSVEGKTEDVDLENAWWRAAESIVEEHNRRADPRAARDSVGPAQRFALDLLRDPNLVMPDGAVRAEEALSVERSTAVRRELNGIRAELAEERITRNEAVERIVELVEDLGLRAVKLDEVPEEIDVDDLGVVCWMAVLD